MDQGFDPGGGEVAPERLPLGGTDHEEVRGPLDLRARGHEAKRQAVEQFPVPARQGGAPSVCFRQRGEALVQHRRLDLIETAVPSRRDVVVARALPARAEALHARREAFLRRGHEARIAEGSQILGGVEAEGGGSSEGAERPPAEARSVRLAGVLDDGNAAAGRRLEQSLPAGASMSEDVHRNDRPDVLSLERPSRGVGVEAEALRLHVGEDRDRPGVLDAERRVAGGERGGEDPVAGTDARRRQGESDGVRAGGHSDGVPDAERFREGPLERLHLRAKDEATRGQHPLDRPADGGIGIGLEALERNVHDAAGRMARTVSARPASSVHVGFHPRSRRIADQSEWKSPIAMSS